MYTGGPKPEDMYPPGGYPPQGPGDVYTTPNSGVPFGYPGQQPQYPPPQYGPPPPQGGFGYPQQGGYPPPQGGYPPPQGGYPPPQGGYGYPPPQDYSQGGYYGQPPPQQSAPMHTGPYRPGGNQSDLEYGESGDYSGFTDPEVRKSFVKKVYSILSVQLLITAAIVYPFLYVDRVQEFVDDRPFLVYIAMGIYFVVMMALVCCEGARRSFPCNFILLGLLTLSLGFMCGVISSRYSTQIVLITLGMTALICLIVTLIAWFAPVDITGCGLLMCLMAMGLMIFGLITTVCVMFFHIKIMVLVYSAVAVVVFCVFLMFDTQQIMGGKRIELSPEEYVLGALQLYVDVIQIFLNLLPLVAACFNDN